MGPGVKHQGQAGVHQGLCKGQVCQGCTVLHPSPVGIPLLPPPDVTGFQNVPRGFHQQHVLQKKKGGREEEGVISTNQ